MRAALRPYVTAGVALVGASVVAVAPIAATPPDVKIANPAIQLAASPFDPYVTALVRARNNIEVLILQALADPAAPFTLEGLLNGLLADPAANFEAFVDGLEWSWPLPGRLNLPARSALRPTTFNLRSTAPQRAISTCSIIDLILELSCR